jgi:hypothetical protein
MLALWDSSTKYGKVSYNGTKKKSQFPARAGLLGNKVIATAV